MPFADFSRDGATEGRSECSSVGATLILGTANGRLVGANEGSKDSSKEGTVNAEGDTLGAIKFEGCLGERVESNNEKCCTRVSCCC